MPHWQNWSGKQRSTVDAIHFARSVDDIAAVVTQPVSYTHLTLPTILLV